MIPFIKKHTSLINILIGILYLIIINTVVFPLFPQLFGTTLPYQNILDLKFGFDKQTVIHSFQSLSPKQLQIYMYSTIFVDIPYALTYWIVYAMIIYGVSSKLNIPFNLKKTLIFLPVIISLSDILENMGIITIIILYPHLPNWLITITSISNMIKWSFAGITFLTIIVLLFAFLNKNK